MREQTLPVGSVLRGEGRLGRGGGGGGGSVSGEENGGRVDVERGHGGQL